MCCAALPPGTRFAVYAIQVDPYQPPFAEGTIPTAKSPIVQEKTAACDKLKGLCKSVRDGIELLYCAYNYNDETARKQSALFHPL